MTGQGSRGRAALLVIAVFVLGAALGGVGTYSVVKRTVAASSVPMTDQQRHAHRVERLTRELSLTADQQKLVDEILAQWESRYKAIEQDKALWNGSLTHRALLVAPPALFVVLLGSWVFRGRPTAQYYTAKVDKGDISQVVTATGTINAVITVQVGSQVSGNVQKLFVDFNSRVKKGQLIAQIDPAIFKAQLEQAQADLHNSQANVDSLQAAIETQRADLLAQQAGVEKAQAQLGDAQLQWKRNKDLADQGIVSAQQADTLKAAADAALAGFHEAQAMYEQSKAKLNSSIANLAQAKAQVEQKRATVDLAQLNLDHCKIYAPIDGTVVARNVDAGQTVAASLQAPVLFTIAQDLTKMQVYAKTDEADVGRIKVGAVATFKVDSFPRA